MPHPTDVHVGRKVREARATRNMSQEQLGKKLGISFQQVQKYEKGTNRVGASRLYEISQHLQTPIAYFFEGLDESQDERVLPRRTIQLAHQIESIQDQDIRNQILNLIKSLNK